MDKLKQWLEGLNIYDWNVSITTVLSKIEELEKQNNSSTHVQELIEKALNDGLNQGHYSFLHPDTFPPIEHELFVKKWLLENKSKVQSLSVNTDEQNNSVADTAEQGKEVSHWEVFCDTSYYHMWAVRPIGDESFKSPNLHHFNTEQEARDYAKYVSTKPLPTPPHPSSKG